MFRHSLFPSQHYNKYRLFALGGIISNYFGGGPRATKAAEAILFVLLLEFRPEALNPADSRRGGRKALLLDSSCLSADGCY